MTVAGRSSGSSADPAGQLRQPLDRGGPERAPPYAVRQSDPASSRQHCLKDNAASGRPHDRVTAPRKMGAYGVFTDGSRSVNSPMT